MTISNEGIASESGEPQDLSLDYKQEVIETVIYGIAQLAHSINKVYCESLGDNSQPTWDEAPEWQKESAINGVKFHMLNPDATPEDSHKNWLAQKKEEGWKWGPVKDPEKKEHPCYIEYERLPQEQRSKDYLFRGVVHAMLQLKVR